MKKLFLLLFLFCFVLTGCEPGEMNFNEEYIELNLTLPYENGFESSDDMRAVVDTKPFLKWEISPIGFETSDYKGNAVAPGNSVLKRIDTGEKIIFPPGGFLPALMIGNKAWENYSVSFDFYFGEAEYIAFSTYFETNSTEVPDFLEGDQRFCYMLENDGELIFHTIFGHFSHAVNDSDKTPIIDNLYTDKWNHIEITPVEKKLHIIINEVDIGPVVDLKDLEYGQLAIEGSIGAMFDNVKVWQSE